ncbi:response regulator transcription factor [Nannocystis sp.]|uniref:response regulator n=1 Tax=Nannocystis sp. TaxID=1962667 RepID=UPI0025D6C15A|nr:response regulator transcription factor [Nannocystis sp.]MBK7827495.1 response regulator transcription factor [Nannocystis sp.]
MRVLVVEDNRQLARLLEQGLREAGCSVVLAHDGRAGLRVAQEGGHDVLVVDWLLPELDGLALLRALRRARDATPVLMLTARDAVADRVAALDAGADDYLVKPFAFVELLARLRALERRRKGAAASVIAVADLEIDTVGRTARRGGRELGLSAREFAVLERLALGRGRIVTREQLHDHVYDAAADLASNVVDVHVANVRKKVDVGFECKLIHTRRGLGYVLEVPT